MTTSTVTTATTALTFPHADKHFAKKWTCPCCGQGDELDAGKTENYGDEVFENMACPKCDGEWRNEYRLFCIRRNGTGVAVLSPSQPLAALHALSAASWLDADPSDSDELAAAKHQARESIEKANKPS